MCGIAGCLAGSARQAEIGDHVRRMADALVHRGPDDGGVWVDPTAPFAVSHRRLAILDLTSAGRQPMLSSSGRFVISFNGEIYNHLELRRELDFPAWRGNSDTETILAAIEVWGLKRTLQKLVGMFAFALWDRVRRELSLARDRIGEKPLYYGWQGNTFLFGSELKALAAHPAWSAKVDRGALTAFMRYGYVPLPHSIWCGIRKLLPGGFVVLPEGAAAGSAPTPEYYWRALSEITAIHPIPDHDNEAADELEKHLRIATSGQMVADVPLGAFLSGGVDSSLVVALMQTQSSRPVRTFSIGFSEGEFNEAVYAKAVASHLGTDHTELYLQPADALKVIPHLAQMYDEPFGDSSQIATHLVAALARRDVAVCLSGDGGDELFGGYNRYFWGRSIWQKVGLLPPGLRRIVAGMIMAISPEVWDRMGRIAPARLRQRSFGDRLHKFAGVIDSSNREDLYRRLLSQQRHPEATVICGLEPHIWADDEASEFSARRPKCDFVERMMFQDLIGYMSDDILTKVDRAAMSVSLETRIPMLDHRVVEFAWSLPLHMKIRDGQGKWLLRQVLYRYVPKQLIERPKQGFGVPLASWLRGPLRDWAEALLDESRLRREGYLRPEPIRARWQEHLAGSRNWQYWLWNVLVFQAWRERWIGEQ